MTADSSVLPTEDPKDRILDAAERLFTERGAGATSLRAITGAAGMNPAAIHYHYGSKEALLLAVARRRADPVNRKRLVRLDQLEQGAGEGAVALEDLIEAFLRPEIVSNPTPVSAVLHHERGELVERLIPELYGEIHGRFVAALGRTLPELGTNELKLRFRLMVGVMLHVARGFAEIAIPATAKPMRLSEEAMLRQVVSFSAAGLRAPAQLPAPEEPAR